MYDVAQHKFLDQAKKGNAQVNITQAKRLLKNTTPADDKFSGLWKDHYTRKFMYAIADDNTFVIAAIDGWNPLCVGVAEFEYSDDVGEKPNLVRVLTTGKVSFTDGLWESYKIAIK